MLRRSLAAACAFLIAFVTWAGAPALAQSDSGEIVIVVVDAQTKQPIDLARVLLDGPVITSEITTKSGKVDFTDVPDGIYRARIVKRGYQSLTSDSFEVLDGRLVTVSFALGLDTGGLKVIGTVTAKVERHHFEHEHRPELTAAPALKRPRRRAQQTLGRQRLDLERR